MKRYKLKKDLPTFKSGDMFYIDELGSLCAEDTQGQRELVAYMSSTLKKFPNILEEWFEEIEEKTTQLRHRPAKGNVYYLIDGYYGLDADTDERNYWDDMRWSLGNYFSNEKDAQRALAKLEAYAKVKSDAKGFEPGLSGYKYTVIKFIPENKLTIDCVLNCENLTIYFATEEDAEASLKTHRKEWLLLFDLDLEKKCEK